MRFGQMRRETCALSDIGAGHLGKWKGACKSGGKPVLQAQFIVAMALAIAVTTLQAKPAERAIDQANVASTDRLKIGVLQECNIFTTDETPRFRVYSAVADVNWSIRDANGAPAGQGILTVDPKVGNGILQVAQRPAGFYTLTISDLRNTRRAGFAVLDPHPVSGSAQASMFGVNSHGANWEASTHQQAVDALTKIGIRHIREDNSYWDQVEKEPGRYGFAERANAVIQKEKDAEIDPLVLLAYGNRFYDGGETPNSEAAIEAAGRYAAAVVQHYGRAVPAVEVWNEYYGGFSTGPCKQSPDCYFRLLKSVYLHVKAVSPETLIVAPAAFKVPVDWLSALFERGALDYLDAVSVHPYRSPGRPEGLETDLENLQSLIKKYNHGQSKPIWITEQGWSTQGGHPAGVDELHQAFYAVRSAVLAQSAGVARNYWYDLLNDGTDANESEQNFGLLRRPDRNADGITPKPVYVAYGVAAQLLSGKKAAGTCLNDKTARCYRFDDTRGSLRVAWGQSPQPVTVTMNATEPVELTDAFGKRRILYPADGQISVELTESPVYLSGTGELHKSDGQLVTGPALAAAVTQPIPLTVHAWDCRGQSHDKHAGVALLIEGTRYPVNRCTSTILMPPQSETGPRAFVGELQSHGLESGYVAAHVEVVADVVSARVYPEITRIGEQIEERLRVVIENNHSQTAESINKIEWVYGSQSGAIDAPTELSPLSRVAVSIPIKSVAFFGSAIAKVSVHTASGKTAMGSNTFGFSPVMRATPQLVAGEFRGLGKIPVINLAVSGEYKTVSQEEVSGKVWMTWDDENLYIAAHVLEPRYVVQKNPRWLQAGDSLGIGLQPGEPGEDLGKSGADWYNLYAGATDTGTAVFRESLPMDIMTVAHVQVERDQKTHTTSYLLALPWHSLQPLSPEHALFSAVLTLNKNDGQGRPGYFSLGLKGWEGWGSGLNDFRLDRYQTLVLVR